ncbi:hypothetical protein [Salmonella phage SS9]|nr:hypothetical protein HYP88_gp140 [Salmonella phage SS9]QEI24305.1 hypothetical protein [Salmonella phage SS9]
MGLTVKRVLDIEEKLNTMPYMARPHVLGCELLNEMMIDENLVETIITREQMKTVLSQGEPHVE